MVGRRTITSGAVAVALLCLRFQSAAVRSLLERLVLHLALRFAVLFAVYRGFMWLSWERVEKMLDVLWAKTTWTSDELQMEMPALITFSGHLEGPDDEKGLLSKLQPS